MDRIYINCCNNITTTIAITIAIAITISIIIITRTGDDRARG